MNDQLHQTAAAHADSEGRDTQALLQAIRAAARDGFHDALTSETTEHAARKFWAIGLDVLRQEANDQAGRFVWLAVKDLAKRGAYVAVFLALIYAAGGWGLLKTVALSLWAEAKS